MPAEIHIAAPKRERRTHAERTAETRRRIKRAVVEGIAELGYHRTTGTEIARRAGVSWGAVQHQFGDKNGVLAAAIEESFNRFAAHLGEAPPTTLSLDQRVSEFIDRAWKHFGSDHYRTTFEILLNLPPEMDSAWALGMMSTWTNIWQGFFPESRLSKPDRAELMHYSVSVLSGLATTALLEGRNARVTARGLDMLKETLVKGLTKSTSKGK